MKDPKTIDQQVQILINRGLIINNIELIIKLIINLFGIDIYKFNNSVINTIGNII